MFFPSTCSLYPASSNNGYDDSFGTASTPKCRYEKIDKILTKNGQQFTVCAWLQFPVRTTITKKDKIVLPDGTTSPIVSLFAGKLCVEVYLGEKSGGF